MPCGTLTFVVSRQRVGEEVSIVESQRNTLEASVHLQAIVLHAHAAAAAVC
jgi:hypothetical protein